MSGVNGNVIMSGWWDDNPDDERRQAVKDHKRVFQGEVTVVQGALVLGVSERQC